MLLRYTTLLFRFIPLIIPFLLSAQLSDWGQKQIIEVQNSGAEEKLDYTALLQINTTDLVSNGSMQANGADIRLAMDCEGVDVIPHFLESGIGTSNTKLWCLLPKLPGNGDTTIYFFYGNETAESTSSFDDAFPNQLIIETTDTLQGLITDSVWSFNYIRIAEDVLVKFDPSLTLPWRLRMDASKIEIFGELDGSAMGYPGVVAGDGDGPGGGFMETTGGGGAAYGGNGGHGGGHEVDAGGAGGITYGTVNGKDIDAGSGGGAAGLAGGGNPGANGGIQFLIKSIELQIDGILNASGGNGLDTEASYSPGGGSGGGVLIETQFFSGSGTINASGGDGGSSPLLYYPGGGAGGGRIKVFHSGSNSFSGNLDVTAGLPGLGTSADLPEGGQDGSVYSEMTAAEITTQVSELVSDLNILSPLCKGADIILEAETGGSNYIFFVNNNEVQNSSNNQYILNSLASSVSVYCEVQLNDCRVSTPVLNLTLNDIPLAEISSANGLNGFCENESITLLASTGSGSFTWNLNGTSLNQDNQNNLTANQPGDYVIQITDPDGCYNESVPFTLNEFQTPSTDINLDVTEFCENDSLLLQANSVGDNTVLWFKEQTLDAQQPSYWIKESGFYSGQFISPEGCEGNKIDFTIVENPLPTATIINERGPYICENETQNIVLDGISNEMVQWFLNQSPIANETSSTLTISQPGIFHARVTSTAGCAIETEEILFEAFPEALAMATGPIEFCEGSQTTLEAGQVPTSISYQWLRDNQPLENATTNQLDVQESGAFSLVISHEAGCSDTSETIEIEVFPLPQPTINYAGPTELCENVLVQLSTDLPNAAHVWQHEGSVIGTESTIEIQGSGKYWTTVTDQNQCTNNSDTLEFLVFPTPNTPEITLSGDSLISSIIGTSYNWFFNGVLINNQNNFFITPAEDGPYQVAIIDENGCVSNLSEPFNYSRVGISDRERFLKFKVFPNPSSGIFNLNGAKLPGQITITNLSGQRLLKMKGAKILDLSQLKKGIYLLSASGFAPEKIVIQ